MKAPKSEIVLRQFEPFKTALSALKSRLNPDGENLHFHPNLKVSASDLQTLHLIGAEGLIITREHWDHFFNNPYAAEMFWYDYMLLVSAVSLSWMRTVDSRALDRAVPVGILNVLLGICDCMIEGGDSGKRCKEALGNLLLAFKDESLRDMVRTHASPGENGEEVQRFLKNVLEQVRVIEMHK